MGSLLVKSKEKCRERDGTCISLSIVFPFLLCIFLVMKISVKIMITEIIWKTRSVKEHFKLRLG